MKLCLMLVMVVAGWGQPVTDVSKYPSTQTPAMKMTLDGSSRLQYICQAVPIQPVFTWSRSDSTLTSVVVLTNTATVTTSTAHGLQTLNPVTFVGGPSGLAGTYLIQTVGSSTTFTITTSGVANGTYTTAGMSVSTNAPRTTAAVWSILQLVYSGADTIPSRVLQSNGRASSFTSICDNQAVTTGSTKIAFQ